jgi:hypothetical protein
MANTHLAHTQANSGACIQPAPSPPTRDRSQYRDNTTPLRHNATDSAAHANATIVKPANIAQRQPWPSCSPVSKQGRTAKGCSQAVAAWAYLHT